MLFKIPALIADVSAAITLEPGDIIVTGTPDGVGAGRTPRSGYGREMSSRPASTALGAFGTLLSRSKTFPDPRGAVVDRAGRKNPDANVRACI